jgi:hypothetical protein
MRHEAALKSLDELDAGQPYGLALRMHLSRCATCAAAARLMEAALRDYRQDLPGEEASRVEDRVMAAVRLMAPPQQDFALRDWLFPGAILAISMVVLPFFGKDLGFLESLLGPSYELSIFLVLGVAFTAYSALFIATHLSELQSFLEKRGVMLPR